MQKEALRRNLTDPLVLLGFDETGIAGPSSSESRWVAREPIVTATSSDSRLPGRAGVTDGCGSTKNVELPCSPGFAPCSLPPPHHQRQPRVRIRRRRPPEQGKRLNLHRMKAFRPGPASSMPWGRTPSAPASLGPGGPASLLATDRGSRPHRRFQSEPEIVNPAPIRHFVEFSLRAQKE